MNACAEAASRDRYGGLYAAVCLVPLAIHLLNVVPPPMGGTVVDLICDGDVLAEQLARLGEPRAHRVEALSIGIETLAHGADSSWRRGGAAYCLLTSGFAPEVINEAAATYRGQFACLAWTVAGARHELVLVDALLHEVGWRSPFLDKVMYTPSLPGLAQTSIRDVIRFDSTDHYWSAMVDGRAICAEIEAFPDRVRGAIRNRCTDLLEPYRSLDDTLRIPVDATVFHRTQLSG